MAATAETPPSPSSTGPGSERDQVPPAEAVNAEIQHEDEKVDEWEEESFPASDPPQNW